MRVRFDDSTNHWRIPINIESFPRHKLIIPWINLTVTVKSQNMWNSEDQWLWLTSAKEKRISTSMNARSTNCNRSIVGSETANNRRSGKIELQKPTLEKVERRSHIPLSAYGKEVVGRKVVEIWLWKWEKPHSTIHKIMEKNLRKRALQKSPCGTKQAERVLQKDLVAEGYNCRIKIAEGGFD